MGLGFVFVSQIWWFFFFLYFVGGIFRFTSFIFGFAIILGLLDLGIRLNAKKIARKMLFCDDLCFWVFTDFFVCDFGSGLAGFDGAGLGATKKTRLLNGSGSSYGYRPAGRVRV